MTGNSQRVELVSPEREGTATWQPLGSVSRQREVKCWALGWGEMSLSVQRSGRRLLSLEMRSPARGEGDGFAEVKGSNRTF